MRPIRGLISKQALRRMAKYSKICVYTIGVLMSLLALLPSLKQAPLTSPAKPPRRFFPAGSAVIDFPFGNMNPIVDLLQSEEILFVMYYAPWCSESVMVRDEFQKAAKYMIEKMKFVGVNCWWPEGSCRNTYKFLKYPELFVYHTNLDGFRFNGIPTADELVRFAEDLLYPITYLHTIESINNFSALHDNIVIGNFDLSTPTPPGLRSYYVAAMKMIEYDHFQPVRFSIVSKPWITKMLGISTKQFVLFNLNGSFIYPQDLNFTSDSIIKWIHHRRYENLVKWISVQGHKSLQLSQQLSKGPALLVFAPFNRLQSVDFYYVILRELMLQYQNCNQKTILILLESLLKRQRQHALDSMVLPYECRPSTSNSTVCCVTLFRQSHVCELCKRRFDSRVKDSCQFSASEQVPHGGLGHYLAPSCFESYQHYNTNEYRTFTCKECDPHSSHNNCGSRHSTDPYVTRLVNSFSRSKCNRISLQKSLYLEQSIYNPAMDSEPVPEEFTGFKCRHNRTVSVVILDKNKHQAFLDRLGSLVPNDTSVSVIIDKENEEQYLMRQPFSKHNIASFVMNFTRGDLPRQLRSEVTPTTCVNELCVLDATSSTFQNIVMEEDKDVLMLLYTPWCGFCSKFSHTYLSLVKYFREATNIVFARMNGNENDLPWQYTIDRYPTLLFFPAHRKADSVKFPESVPLTLPNLVRFILHHATYDLRMDTAVDVCTKSCIEKNLRRVSLAVVSCIKKQKILENRMEKLESRYKMSQTSVRFKSSVRAVRKRLRDIDKQYRNAFILLKFLKSSEKLIDKDKLKNVLNNKKYMKVDRHPNKKLERTESQSEL